MLGEETDRLSCREEKSREEGEMETNVGQDVGWEKEPWPDTDPSHVPD